MAQEWALHLTEKQKRCGISGGHAIPKPIKIEGKNYVLGENLYSSKDPYIDDCAQAVASWYR